MDAQLLKHKIEKAHRRVDEMAYRNRERKLYERYLAREIERMDSIRKAFRKKEYTES